MIRQYTAYTMDRIAPQCVRPTKPVAVTHEPLVGSPESAIVETWPCGCSTRTLPGGCGTLYSCGDHHRDDPEYEEYGVDED